MRPPQIRKSQRLKDMQTLVLLDSNSLINRAFYALPPLTNRQGQQTGAIFGFVNMFLKLVDKYKPDYVVAAFDRKAPTFRKKMYEGYKATRKPMPEELATQLEPLKRLLRAMKVQIAELDGYEADDILGTLSKRTSCKTYIVTGDRDSLQLIGEKTTVLMTKKGISEIVEYDEARLKEDGFTPSQIIDLKSLMGDSSDNIPGVAGIGEGTATKLLAQYGTLDGVYAHIDETKGALNRKLTEGKESAYLSYKLATIDRDCPIETVPEEQAFSQVYDSSVKDILLEFEFGKIADRLNFSGGEKAEIKEIKQAERLEDDEALSKALSKIKDSGIFALDLSQRIFIGGADSTYEVVISENLLGEGIDYNAFLRAVKPLAEDEDVRKILFDKKTYMHLLEPYGITLKGVSDDVMLKAYLCDSNRNYKSLSALASAYGINGDDGAAALFALDDLLDEEMREKEQEKLYKELELPLVDVLYSMEREGFRVDRKYLDELNGELTAETEKLAAEITELAGEPFNINSTQQLAKILFEKLGLKHGKKTKTGYSTNVEVLEALRNEHPIIPAILQYRELVKLKSTYLDGMIPLIDSNGRIHTVFKQAVTATGRLSSTEPNLQNIPIRKESGKRIRKMFVPADGNVLVCGDYSQIELRLMAHMSGDETMIGAFNEGEDFHRSTAAKLFGVPFDEVTQDMRRSAKAVNFGIIYGISDFGLSEDLGISVPQARVYMQNYFATYPKVKQFMNDCVAFAKENGYVKTLYGRKRYIPELQASVYATRAFGERVAMNMPLQGTASDIIKAAMIEVKKELEKGGFKAKLIMQVHDELIIDCPREEKEKVETLLKNCMQNVASLSVPLIADVGSGDNWLEAK